MEPPAGDAERSRIATEYEPVQPTYAQSTSRIRKPSLDDMGPGSDCPVPARSSPSPRERGEGLPSGQARGSGEGQPPARAPNVDPRAKAGAFGEGVRGPHKPTLDEMGPHASLPVPAGKKVSDPSGLTPRTTPRDDGVRPRGSDTERTARTTEKEKRGRRGRPRKTGRPGH